MRTPFQEFEYRPDQDAQYCGEQSRIECHPIPQGIGQRNHPLTDGNRWNDTVDKMRGRIRHSAPATRPAKAPVFAGIRKQPVFAALRTPEAQKNRILLLHILERIETPLRRTPVLHVPVPAAWREMFPTARQ
jgi:hypothetical protein